MNSQQLKADSKEEPRPTQFYWSDSNPTEHVQPPVNWRRRVNTANKEDASRGETCNVFAIFEKERSDQTMQMQHLLWGGRGEQGPVCHLVAIN